MAGAALGAQRGADRGGMDVDAVGDQSRRQRAEIERRAHHAGLAIAKLALGVEQMRHHGGASLSRRFDRGIARV